jgi:integrase
MPRPLRDTRLDTREARSRLPRAKEPYWHAVRRGLSIGYYRGSTTGTWHLREYRGGRLWKREIGVADDSLPADGSTVLSWRDALRIAIGDERPTATAIDNYTVGDALRDYWAARAARSTPVSLATDKAKASAVIEPRWAACDVNTLDPADLRRWFNSLVPTSGDPEEKRRGQATANRTWSIMRAVLNQAYRDGRATSADAWRRIRPFRNVDRARTRFLTTAEAKRALNAMRPDFRQLARGALYTGMRLGELLALRVGDIYDTTIRIRHSKSGKARSVPLSDDGQAFFDQVTAGKAGDAFVFTKADGTAWHRMDASRQMAKVSKVAKLAPPATFHDLRRSYASLLINAGTDAEIIKELLGHADLRMTVRAYAHLKEATIAKAVNKNLPDFGREKSNTRKLRQ